jgi:hypothetical protein
MRGGLALLAAALCLTPAAASAQACDRACLTSFLDRYFDALARHDSSPLPLAAPFKATQNGVPIQLSGQLWRTAGAPSWRLDAIDPQTGQAAALAVLPLTGDKAAYMVRIKVVAMKITEIETILVHREDNPMFAAENWSTPPALFLQPPPAGEREGRSGLVKAADAYFNAIQTSGAAGYQPAPFTPQTNRFENGLQTTNVALGSSKPQTAEEQMASGIFKGGLVTNRRYLLADEERGVVLALVMFRGGPAMLPSRRGRSSMVAEMFKVTGGKIRQIQAVFTPLPVGAEPGWE